MPILGLALFMTLQGAMACFASAQSIPRCHDRAASAVNADSGHMTAGHSHDQAESADHRHDSPVPVGGADLEGAFDCCGWMCAAAIFQAVPDTLPYVPQSRLGHFWHGAAPPGWLAIGLDRPPRSRIIA